MTKHQRNHEANEIINNRNVDSGLIEVAWTTIFMRSSAECAEESWAWCYCSIKEHRVALWARFRNDCNAIIREPERNFSRTLLCLREHFWSDFYMRSSADSFHCYTFPWFTGFTVLISSSGLLIFLTKSHMTKDLARRSNFHHRSVNSCSSRIEKGFWHLTIY